MPSRYWKRSLFLPLLLLMFLGGSQLAHACSCGPRPTVLDSYDHSDVVVVLRALSVEKAEDTNERHYVDGVRSTTMLVEKVFKGNLKVGDEIVFGQGGGADCIWTFNEKSVGHQFLFYLISPDKNSDRSYLPSTDLNLWFAGGCGRSTGLGGATDDLLYLENMDKLRGRTRISGTIGVWPTPPELNVERKKIKIIGPKKTYEATTDRHGVFEIYDLPPGKYLVEPEMSAGYKIDPFMLRYSPSVVRNDYEEPEFKKNQVAITLEPKKHAGVDIAFQIDNVVRGKVVGPKGKPMVGACVALPLSDAGEGGGGGDCTDEKGVFEITSVPSGSYVVAVNVDGKLSSSEPFGTFYYPNVSDRARAAVITIGPGEVINDVNIVVPSLAETITVEGVLRYSDGKPVVDEYVEFEAEKAERIDGDVNEKTDANGHFSLKLLKGVKGELSAEDYVYIGEYENCPKLDSLIRKSGRDNTTLKTNVIPILADRNIFNLELVFPFPACKKKE
jgi:hypothetical protein